MHLLACFLLEYIESRIRLHLERAGQLAMGDDGHPVVAGRRIDISESHALESVLNSVSKYPATAAPPVDDPSGKAKGTRVSRSVRRFVTAKERMETFERKQTEGKKPQNSSVRK
ncbi:Centromere protein Mis12 [Penicillium herquei]|nr:Centromere protein Mis12 [Penicillium herquei]